MTVARRFAEFAAGLAKADIPEATLHSARRCLVDWYGATIAGGVLPPATRLERALVAPGTAGDVRLIPSGTRTDARTAALINGAASHTVEVDDIYRDGLYHPGSPVIAAATALAEQEGRGGDALLRAIIAGYEVSNRIAKAVNPAHYRYWHTTATVGFFGATAAAASLLELDATATTHALTTSVTFAAGLQQAFRSDAMTKPLHAGRAAEGGVLAALGARAGITGVPDMFEGARGFGAAMSAEVDWDAATGDLGRTFTIDRTTQKAHACCGHTFAANDAVHHIVAEHGLTPDHIAQITVRTYGAALEICGNSEPRTPYEAKFSLAYCVASAVLSGRVGPSAFTPELLHRPELRRLMGRTTLELDPGCEAAFPSRRSATVAVTTTDGRTFEHHRPTRRGDPDDPLTDDELSAKFRELADPVLRARTAADLKQALWRIDDLQDVRALPLVQDLPVALHG